MALPPMGVFDDGFLHIDFRDRTVTFDARPLDLNPPQYNVFVGPASRRARSA
jgi:hypothetical protein